jgi:hypothetical protein
VRHVPIAVYRRNRPGRVPGSRRPHVTPEPRVSARHGCSANAQGRAGCAGHPGATTTRGVTTVMEHRADAAAPRAPAFPQARQGCAGPGRRRRRRSIRVRVPRPAPKLGRRLQRGATAWRRNRVPRSLRGGETPAQQPQPAGGPRRRSGDSGPRRSHRPDARAGLRRRGVDRLGRSSRSLGDGLSRPGSGAFQQTIGAAGRCAVRPRAGPVIGTSKGRVRPVRAIGPTSTTGEDGGNLVLRRTDGALRRLADRTIVWTHVQFAVTEFGSPLIAMDSARFRVRSPAKKS